MNMYFITFRALYDDAIEFEKEQMREYKKQNRKVR